MERSEALMKVESGGRVPTDSEEEAVYRSVFGGERTAVFDPERKLLAAVLETALEDLSNPKLRMGAAKWFLSQRSDSLFQFVPVCGALGLDPEAVRRAVLGRKGNRAENIS